MHLRAPCAPSPMPDRWLTAERLRVYPKLALGAYLLCAFGLVLASKGGVDPRGKPLGYDFLCFYAGGRMALAGQAAAAYDLFQARQAQLAVFPSLGDVVFGWYYPPTYFLIQAPLALLPYWLAWTVWTAGTGALLTLAVRPALREPGTTWLLLAAPVVLVNLFHGQNGFLMTALLVLGLRARRRPALAGLCFGALTLKPQLGLLVPVVLALTRQWRTILWAAATAAILVALSVACFGLEPWRVFLTANASLLRALLERGILPWPMMTSTFAAASMLGAPPVAAWALHAAWAVFVASVTAWLWWRRAPFAIAASALMLGTLAATPHGFYYDMVLALPPMWLLARRARRTGWLPLEREAILAAYLAPALVGLAEALKVVPVMPAALGLLFVTVLRRYVAEEGRTGGTEPVGPDRPPALAVAGPAP